MNRILTLLTVIFIAIFISSCATSGWNKKYFIGTWKPVKVEKYNIANLSDQQASKIEEKMAGLIQTELLSLLTVNEDNTADKEYAGITFHGTWKWKKKGTHIQFDNDKKISWNITIDVLRMNDTSAVVLENLHNVALKVTYKKEKK